MGMLSVLENPNTETHSQFKIQRQSLQDLNQSKNTLITDQPYQVNGNKSSGKSLIRAYGDLQHVMTTSQEVRFENRLKYSQLELERNNLPQLMNLYQVISFDYLIHRHQKRLEDEEFKFPTEDSIDPIINKLKTVKSHLVALVEQLMDE